MVSGIAIVDDRASQAAEDRLDHVEELSARRQRSGLDRWSTAAQHSGVVLRYALMQALRNMP